MKKPSPFTVAILMVRNGKICLSKRLRTATYSGFWQAAGGSVENGEELYEAAARELHEETGLVVGDHRLKHLGVLEGDTTCKECHIYRLNVRVDEEPKRQKLERAKQTEWEWFTPEAALQLKLITGVEPYVQEILRENIFKAFEDARRGLKERIQQDVDALMQKYNCGVELSSEGGKVNLLTFFK